MVEGVGRGQWVEGNGYWVADSRQGKMRQQEQGQSVMVLRGEWGKEYSIRGSCGRVIEVKGSMVGRPSTP